LEDIFLNNIKKEELPAATQKILQLLEKFFDTEMGLAVDEFTNLIQSIPVDVVELTHDDLSFFSTEPSEMDVVGYSD
jgi:hypothetical protein